MKMRVLAVATLCLGGSLLGGCKAVEQLKKVGEAAQQATSAAAEAAGPSAEEEKDAEMGEKLGHYIECLNRVSRDAFRTKNHYLRDVDKDKGPTGKESSIYVSELNIQYCTDALDKAKAAKPPLPEIEAAAVDYRTSIEALAPLLKQAHDYYDRKDFKDDKFAKGIELHPKLMAAFAAFEKANKPFDDKVTALNEQIGQRQLARLKERPDRKLQYLIEKSVDDAKKIVKFTDIDNIDQLDAAAYNAALEAYQKSFTEFDTYAAQNKAEADKVMMLSMFKSAGEDYLKTAKDLMRRKRDNKDFAKESGHPEHMDGHPAHLIKDFNDVIDRSNSLTFRY